MRLPVEYAQPLDQPQYIAKAQELVGQLQVLSIEEFADLMKLSRRKAIEVHALYSHWSAAYSQQAAAIDTFVGDIYSGLQAQIWDIDDRQYAHQHLFILSGLYGVLRACDGILPYRLEMGYRLPSGESLYHFWGDTLANAVSSDVDCIVNVSSVEYTKALLPYLSVRIVTPKFLTVSPKSGEPTFVTVHTKVARGAFARWMIKQRVQDTRHLDRFEDLGYRYDVARSTPDQPVYVCQTFGGLGLSVRLP